jgi:hypothetical protein
VLVVGDDREHHEISELETSRTLKALEETGRGSNEPEVNVLRGPRALHAKLDDESTLQHRAIAEHRRNPGKKSVEDEELTLAGETAARR